MFGDRSQTRRLPYMRADDASLPPDPVNWIRFAVAMAVAVGLIILMFIAVHGLPGSPPDRPLVFKLSTLQYPHGD